MMVLSHSKNGWALGPLLQGLVAVETGADCEIDGLSSDSRTVSAGQLFFACAGNHEAARAHVDQAIGRGAAAIVTDRHCSVSPSTAVPLVTTATRLERLVNLAAWPGSEAMTSHGAATPGEYEPVTFSIWPQTDLSTVRVTPGDLRSDDGLVLPAEAVRISLSGTKVYVAAREAGMVILDNAPQGN